MALPLKSGADLYNQQLIRAAIWNYSADGIDPREYSTGLMYFNTNPSSNMYQKLRFRTATEWKTIAFAEDLDVASNADFVALKEKVELLSGEVDTDAIISNMKEVTAFLEGFAEDANLMEALNKKLDKTGGEVTGVLTLKTGNDAKLIFDNTDSESFSEISFCQNGVKYARVFFSGVQSEIYGNGNLRYNANTLLHSGNVGEYAATLNQRIKLTDDVNVLGYSVSEGTGLPQAGPTMAFGSATYRAYLYGRNGVLKFNTMDGGTLAGWKTIAFTDSNVASATKLETPRTIWGQSFDGTGNVDGNFSIANLRTLHRSDGGQLHINYTGGTAYETWIYGDTLNLCYGTPSAFKKGFILNSSGNVTIGGVDKAASDSKLFVDGGLYVRYTDDKNLRIKNNTFDHRGASGGYNIYAGIREGECLSIEMTDAAGNWLHKGMSFHQDGTINFGTSSSKVATQINGTLGVSDVASFASRVNVGGATDDANYALNVKGNANFSNNVESGLTAFIGTKQNYGVYIQGRAEKPTLGVLKEGKWKATTALFNPNGDIEFQHNIVADGTIACKGIAEVGTTAAEGTVDKHAEVIEAGQQSYTINHQLHTKEITVCIYEMGGEETVLILTDVTVLSDDVIRVEFGRATDVKHRVVVMG